MATPLVLNVFNMFTWHVHKLNLQDNTTNNKHDTSLVGSVLIHKMGGGKGTLV